MKKLEELRKKIIWDKVLTFFFLLLLIGQFCMLVYFNLTQLKYHLGYDISTNYLKAIETAKQHKLILDHWAVTTSYSIISMSVVAAPFYMIFHNIYTAFGMANICVILLNAFVLFKLMSVFKMDILTKLMGLNFYLCPFITSEYNNACDLGYSSNMLLGASFYSTTILVVLLCLLHLYTRKKTKLHTVLGILLSVLLAAIAFSSGLFIWSVFLVAGMLYYIVEAVLRSDSSYLKTYGFRFFLLNSILSLVARIAGNRILGLKTQDSSLSLVLADDFFSNLGNVFEGFLQFMGALPANDSVSVTGKTGICYLVGWVIVGLLVVAVIWVARSVLKEKEGDWKQFFLFIILENVVLFAICKVTYGGGIFENRYLLVSLFSMLFLLLAYFEFIKKNKYIYIILVGALAFSILVLDVAGDYKYLKTKIDYQQLEEIAAVIGEYNIPLVYAYGSEVANDVRNLRLIDQSKIYKTISHYNLYVPWGDYSYYQDNADYNGENCLIATQEEFEELPDFIKKDYTVVTSIDKYNIYHANISKFDLSSTMNEYTIDFPYSYGFETCNGEFDEEGQWVTDGTEGYCLYGPYCKTKQGVYDIKLNYEIIEQGEKPCVLDIALNRGTQVLVAIDLDNEKQTVEIHDLELEDGNVLEYRIFNSKDCKLKVKSIEVTRQ